MTLVPDRTYVTTAPHIMRGGSVIPDICCIIPWVVPIKGIVAPLEMPPYPYPATAGDELYATPAGAPTDAVGYEEAPVINIGLETAADDIMVGIAVSTIVGADIIVGTGTS